MHAAGWQCQLIDRSLTLRGVMMSIVEERNEVCLLHLRLQQLQCRFQLSAALVHLDEATQGVELVAQEYQ
jgi:hypothetical protein